MSDIGGGKAAADIENDPANKALIAKQQAEAAAGNKDGGDPAPGSFATKAEAEAYLAQQRDEGRYPRVMDEETGDFTIEDGGRWHTAVADTPYDAPDSK